jgi:hypothetical protein
MRSGVARRYGTPRELFGKFFGVIADTYAICWSAEMESAWPRLLERSTASLRTARYEIE